MKLVFLTMFDFFKGLFLFLFGEIDIKLKYLIVVVAMDYISGLCRAVVKKKVNSSIGIKGILKKFCYFLVVAIAVILGELLEVGLSIRNITVYSLIINECISILENCTQMGIVFPKIISSSLSVFNNKLKEEEEIIIDKKQKKTKD